MPGFEGAPGIGKAVPDLGIAGQVAAGHQHRVDAPVLPNSGRERGAINRTVDQRLGLIEVGRQHGGGPQQRRQRVAGTQAGAAPGKQDRIDNHRNPKAMHHFGHPQGLRRVGHQPHFDGLGVHAIGLQRRPLGDQRCQCHRQHLGNVAGVLHRQRGDQADGVNAEAVKHFDFGLQARRPGGIDPGNTQHHRSGNGHQAFQCRCRASSIPIGPDCGRARGLMRTAVRPRPRHAPAPARSRG